MLLIASCILLLRKDSEMNAQMSYLFGNELRMKQVAKSLENNPISPYIQYLSNILKQTFSLLDFQNQSSRNLLVLVKFPIPLWCDPLGQKPASIPSPLGHLDFLPLTSSQPQKTSFNHKDYLSCTNNV